MKILITIALIFVASVSMAQHKPQKWVPGGCGLTFIGDHPIDTITKCYLLRGKDSLTYTISTQKCNCDFYTTIEDHKIKPCKGLILHSVEVHFMYWCKDITFIKGIKHSETKPHWDSSMGQLNTIQGEYEQNGKLVYIHSIHLLNNKLINNTQPYKFTSEWVTINDY